ncbi:hypothetical protein WAF17_22445 (plasmid) [Bernardetia sp. ABR2-2B]|uniref:hypothetical protein n=1 Tax=Bernardetia sp. ABR2-2B TaxID=3127472 RepID=UPI0030D53D9D
MNIIIEVSDFLVDNIENIFYCTKFAVFVYSLHQKRQKKSDIEEKQQTNQKE